MLDIHLLSDAFTQKVCTRALESVRLGAEVLSSCSYMNGIIIFHLVFIH